MRARAVNNSVSAGWRAAERVIVETSARLCLNPSRRLFWRLRDALIADDRELKIPPTLLRAEELGALARLEDARRRAAEAGNRAAYLDADELRQLLIARLNAMHRGKLTRIGWQDKSRPLVLCHGPVEMLEGDTRDAWRSSPDRDYWLGCCVGFEVYASGTRIGAVEAIRFVSRADKSELVEMRTGVWRRRRFILSIEAIEIFPKEKRIVIRATQSGDRAP